MGLLISWDGAQSWAAAIFPTPWSCDLWNWVWLEVEPTREKCRPSGMTWRVFWFPWELSQLYLFKLLVIACSREQGWSVGVGSNRVGVLIQTWKINHLWVFNQWFLTSPLAVACDCCLLKLQERKKTHMPRCPNDVTPLVNSGVNRPPSWYSRSLAFSAISAFFEHFFPQCPVCRSSSSCSICGISGKNLISDIYMFLLGGSGRSILRLRSHCGMKVFVCC